MKTYTTLNDKVRITINGLERNDFFDALEKIKICSGALYDPILKKWTINNTENNLIVLKENKFLEVIGDNQLEPIPVLDAIEIYNSEIHIFGNNRILNDVYNKFTFKDFSYCWLNGRFDKSKIAERKMLKIKSGFGILPVGFRRQLLLLAKDLNLQDYRVIDNRDNEIIIDESKIKDNLSYLELYDYQIEAVKTCIQKTNCIVKLSTGSGKTEIFISLCNLMKKKTIILFARIDLAKQTLKRTLAAGLDAGIVQGNVIDEDHQIIMVTVQSYHKIQNKYDMIIIDECHRAVSPQYQKILKKKEFIFRFGFSATPFVKKDDWKNAKVTRFIGDIEYELSSDVLVEKGKIAKPIINIITINKPHLMYNKKWVEAEKRGIIHNDYRNNHIADLCNFELKGQILVMVQKIKHGQILEELINNGVFLYGNSDSEKRQEYINKFEKGEKIVLIASTIFDEGISINNINNVIIAGGGLSFIKTLQRIGRGMRIMEGKSSVQIFDFLDCFNETLEKHSKDRIDTYLKEGFTDLKYMEEN